MATYAFLSDEWIEAARLLRQHYEDRLPKPVLATRINVNVTGVPHLDDGLMAGHIDTSEGQTVIEHGHLDDVDLTITVDYDTAKAAFVTRNQQKVMESFLTGKILVEGDASKLLALQSTPPNLGPEVEPLLVEMYEKLNALTE